MKRRCWIWIGLAAAVVILCAAVIGIVLCIHRDPSPPPTVETCARHTDKDGNGTCDVCSVDVRVTLEFFAVNDMHGKFVDSDTQPGVDELSTYFRTYSAGENTVLLSSGDMWQGSSESNLTRGELITDWMSDLDFVSMTLGNHEFDWGLDAIENNAEKSDFPFLAINVYDKATQERVPFCQPSVMVQRSGVNIGIIGAIGDCYSSISGDKVGSVYFETGDALTALVKAESQRLREQGADVIVYSIHDGYDKNLSYDATLASSQLRGYYDTALSDGYVDLVFEGHTHKQYVFQDEHGVYHLQGGGENSGISHAQLAFNTVNRTFRLTEAEVVESREYGSFSDDPIVEDLLERYESEISVSKTVVGQNQADRDKDTLRQLIAELYYRAGQEQWGEAYDIVLGGGFISVRNPWYLAKGDVTYGALQSLFPFDNQIVLCSVSGASLRENFLETNNSNYFIYYEDYGQQVKNDLDPNGTYYIVTDTYCSSYAKNKLTVVESYDPTVFARDLLADYIAEGGLTGTRPPENYTLTDIPTILELGQSLGSNGVSQKSYYVQGTIQSIQNDKYGDVTIVDENGNSLYIFGISDASGSIRYDSMTDKPKVGDTVVLCGQIQKYVPESGDPVIELVHSRMIR